MVQTTLKVKMETFDIIAENDINAKDEPFLWTFYFKIDGSTLNIFKLISGDVTGATVRMDALTPSHHDLNLSNNDMDVADPPAAIPSAIGEWNITLQTDDMMSLYNAGLSKYCMIVALAIGLEHDDTTDADILAIWTHIKTTLQNTLNSKLQEIVKQMLYNGQALTEQQIIQKLKTIDYNLFSDIAKQVIEVSFTKDLFIGLLSPYHLIQSIAESAFPDDFIGYSYAGPYYIADLLGKGKEAIPFQLKLNTQHASDGIYLVKGNIYQPLSAGYSNISLCYADHTNKCLLFARTDSTFIEKYDSPDKTDSQSAWTSLPNGTFLTGPATAMSDDGTKIIVVALGSDNRFWAAYSSDAGSTWNAWNPIGEGTFQSAPAIAMTPNGAQVQIFGLGMDNALWQAVSMDGGINWMVAWQQLPTGTFTSAPSACISSDGKQLHVVARGTDNKFWRGFSSDGGNTWDLAWGVMGEGVFISAPACVMSDDGAQVRVYGRGTDSKFYQGYSTDGGNTWAMWGIAEANGTFISSPAAAMSGNGKIIHLAGIGQDLQTWVACSVDGGNSWAYAWKNILHRAMY
jgi:hypothetical protein